MATYTIEPYPTKPIEPTPWDPNCPACLSGYTPLDPRLVEIAEPAPAETA